MSTFFFRWHKITIITWYIDALYFADFSLQGFRDVDVFFGIEERLFRTNSSYTDSLLTDLFK